MENILKALELAEVKKQQTEQEIPAKIEPATEPASGNEQIIYSSTRVISTDPEALRQHRVIAGMERGPVTNAYRLLRTQVLQRMRENNWNTLAIISPSSHAGKTLTAVNLAISMAMEVNQTVLLVDLDLRTPHLHNYFDYQPEKGLSDYLLHGTPLSQIMFNPSIERLVVLPGRETVRNSSELLSAPKMVKLVEELRTRYPSRLVLFDLPSFLNSDDVLAFSPYVDAVLLVVEEGKTTTEELHTAMTMLQTVNIIGTVLNKSRA